MQQGLPDSSPGQDTRSQLGLSEFTMQSRDGARPHVP